MVHNAKFMVKALLAENKFSQVAWLAKLLSGKEYTKSFLNLTRVLLACTNNYYVNPDDRKDLE